MWVFMNVCYEYMYIHIYTYVYSQIHIFFHRKRSAKTHTRFIRGEWEEGERIRRLAWYKFVLFAFCQLALITFEFLSPQTF